MEKKIVELSLEFKLLDKHAQPVEKGVSFISSIEKVQLTKSETLDLIGQLYEYFEDYPEETEEKINPKFTYKLSLRNQITNDIKNDKGDFFENLMKKLN